jgi:hypothetical protein
VNDDAAPVVDAAVSDVTVWSEAVVAVSAGAAVAGTVAADDATAPTVVVGARVDDDWSSDPQAESPTARAKTLVRASRRHARLLMKFSSSEATDPFRLPAVA